jgi:hypothetical protein
VGDLVEVDDRADAGDLAIRDVEGQHAEQALPVVQEQGARTQDTY